VESRPKIDWSDVRRRAEGQWKFILQTLGVAEDFLRDKHGPCPMCGGRDRFRFDDKLGAGTWICNHDGAGDGIKLVMLTRNVRFGDAVKMVSEVIGGNLAAVAPRPVQVVSAEKGNTDDRIAKARRVNDIWASARPLQPNDEVERYLGSRGLRTPGMGLRYSPICPYFDDDGRKSDDLTAMVARVDDGGGQLCAVHRTYLRAGRKAAVAKPKKVLGELPPGAAIRLAQSEPHLAVAEGIETALAAFAMSGIPCWSLVSAGGIERFDPPAGVSAITVFADNDASYAGQKAAYILAERMARKGIVCDVRMPDRIGEDWNDLLLRDRRENG